MMRILERLSWHQIMSSEFRFRCVVSLCHGMSSSESNQVFEARGAMRVALVNFCLGFGGPLFLWVPGALGSGHIVHTRGYRPQQEEKN